MSVVNASSSSGSGQSRTDQRGCSSAPRRGRRGALIAHRRTGSWCVPGCGRGTGHGLVQARADPGHLALGDPAVHAQGPAPGRRPIGWTPRARRPPSSATPGAQATSAPAPSGCRTSGPSSHAARAIWCSWSPSGCWPWRCTAGGRRSPPSDRSSWPPTPCSEARCCVSAGLPVPALAVGGPPVWMFQFSTVVIYSLAWGAVVATSLVFVPGHPWLSRRPRVVLAVVYLARWRRWRSGRRRARRSRSTRCAGGSCWTRGPKPSGAASAAAPPRAVHRANGRARSLRHVGRPS